MSVCFDEIFLMFIAEYDYWDDIFLKDFFLHRITESATASEAMHAFQWPTAHVLPPWLQKRIVH